jgi:RNA polymerase sigma factor (sigma-70 family)
MERHEPAAFADASFAQVERPHDFRPRLIPMVDALSFEERALRGDRDAWEALIQQHQHRVLVSLLARGIRIDRAREISQEAWARLIAQQVAGRLSRIELPGLAITQALFLARDEARRRATMHEQSAGAIEMERAGDPAPSAETRLIAKDDLHRIERVLQKCAPRAREIFLFAYEHPELAHEEVARHFDVSTQRIRQTLCEVRATLKSAVESVR